MNNKQDKPALVIIDMQKGFDDLAYWGGHRNNPEAEKNASKLLAFWRSHGWPVFHVKHCSVNPGSPLAEGRTGNEFNDLVAPGGQEEVIKKNVNSAFIGTDLKNKLDNAGIKTVVMAGLTTDHCISTSARMSGNLGYDTFVVSDATAAFGRQGADGHYFTAELMHETALASLHNEFATVLSTEALFKVFEAR